jgi:hypothetical protein
MMIVRDELMATPREREAVEDFVLFEGEADWVAEVETRQYLIATSGDVREVTGYDWGVEFETHHLGANDDGGDQKCYLAIQILTVIGGHVGPQTVYTDMFDSVDAAKRYAEDWEDARNDRYREGWIDVGGRAIDSAERSGFASLRADKYFEE